MAAPIKSVISGDMRGGNYALQVSRPTAVRRQPRAQTVENPSAEKPRSDTAVLGRKRSADAKHRHRGTPMTVLRGL